MEPMNGAGRYTVTVTTASTAAADDTEGWVNRRATAQATRAANARQVSGRRRFVDPTTCERDYSVSEMEFMQAMHDYKQQSGRMFPTWSEVLEVLKSLGYAKPQALTAATMDETAGPLYKSSPRTKKAAQPA